VRRAFLLDQCAAHAASAEIHGERETDRTGADNEYICVHDGIAPRKKIETEHIDSSSISLALSKFRLEQAAGPCIDLWATNARLFSSSQRRQDMKRAVFAGVTALALLTAGQALAQSVTVQIAPEQRTRIKEYVVKEKVKPVVVKERVSVGATLPADVELRAVPETWGPGVSRYRYVYSDNNVYLVNPSDRRVVEVID
jgi:hypothetical protein